MTLHVLGQCPDREWLRVARNLISNTVLDAGTFPDTIASLNALAAAVGHDVITGLTDLEVEQARWKPASFEGQLTEERTKASLLRQAPDDWAKIKDGEMMRFSTGRSMSCCGIRRMSQSPLARTRLSNGGMQSIHLWIARNNPIVPGESGDNARWDRLFIRGVLAECDDFTFPANIDIELPGMANGGWGNVLKRTNQPFRKGLQSALLSVLDRLIGRRDSTPEQYIAFLSDLIEHPKPKFPAILHVIQHGEILLQKSEHWKIREYWYVGKDRIFYTGKPIAIHSISLSVQSSKRVTT